MKGLAVCLILILCVHSSEVKFTRDKHNINFIQFSNGEEEHVNRDMEPSAFLQTSENSQENSELKTEHPSYLSEAEEVEHLPHPDDPNDDYKTISLIGKLFKDLVFGDKQVALDRDQRHCYALISPHQPEDEANFKKMKKQLFDFCYKEDASRSFFDVIKSITDMYWNNLQECHSVWGMEGIEETMDWFKDFEQELDTLHNNAEKARKWKLDQVRKFPREDAKPIDATTKENLKEWRSNMDGMVKGLHAVSNELENINHMAIFKQTKEQAVRGQSQPEQRYPKFMSQQRENLLQLIQTVAEHVDFLCKNRQDMIEHLLHTIPMWTEIINAYSTVPSDDDMTAS